MTRQNPETCRCGGPLPYQACCGRFIDGGQSPSTAEELMRSRYSAHVLLDAEYLNKTERLKTGRSVTKADMLANASRTVWRGLEVLRCERGGPDDQRGTVEFAATFDLDGKLNIHHEISTFRRINGHWFYTAGGKPAVTRSGDQKVGRNAPCPCGSGKKYKKCCGKVR